ncbi:MAG: uncharacterized protein KVP18_002917 [Porospora cf. gigantea A]|uniref:uncharacterized protein n=2 Tax=Porospora cf. gigantea A TaxID=2853593 RepID=UPI00355A09F9|nr:MAG: hypothetical protein KVP18_002917 [Porospora cf. gigantea A]
MEEDDALEIPLPGEYFPPTAADPKKQEQLNEDKASILQRCRQFCGWNSASFPGSQPVSLSRGNLEDMALHPYVACEKTDGVRFLLIAVSGMVFLVDRKEELQLVRYHMPKDSDLNAPQQWTILDGELVKDTYVDEGKKNIRVRFLIYDAVTINRDRSIGKLPLTERLKAVYRQVILPRLRWEELHPKVVATEKAGNHYLEIYLKDFFEIWDVAAIHNFSNRLPHLSDGIIFTPVKCPYTPGTCRKLLKWKPPRLNTVDFKSSIVKLQTPNADGSPRYLVQLLVGMRGVPHATDLWLAPFGDKYKDLMTLHQRSLVDRTATKVVDGTIWECFWSPESKTPKVRKLADNRFDWDEATDGWADEGWLAERIRSDKHTPNDVRVVGKVKQSIVDGICFEDLMEAFERFQRQGLKSVASRCYMPSYYKEVGSEVAKSTALQCPSEDDDEEEPEPKRQKNDAVATVV